MCTTDSTFANLVSGILCQRTKNEESDYRTTGGSVVKNCSFLFFTATLNFSSLLRMLLLDRFFFLPRRHVSPTLWLPSPPTKEEKRGPRVPTLPVSPAHVVRVRKRRRRRRRRTYPAKKEKGRGPPSPSTVRTHKNIVVNLEGEIALLLYLHYS